MKIKVTLRDVLVHAKARTFTRVESIINGGTLELWKSGKGACAFYWRVTYEGKSLRYRIGLYDPSAPPKSLSPTKKGYSLNAARCAAEDMAAKHAESRDAGGYQAVVAQEQAAQKAHKESEAASHYTLNKLYALYLQYLRGRNERTAQDARNLFTKNVQAAFPKIAETAANKISTEQITNLLRPLLSNGKVNTARKLKAYLGAAYARAKKPEQNADVSAELAHFKIKTNPVLDVSGIQQTRRIDKNPLMPETMREYWKLIDIPGKEAALLRLHLLLGGQRLEQFVRMRTENVHADLITLIDTKGRAGIERPIHIPRTPAIDAALQAFTPSGDYVLSVTPGHHMGTSALRAWAQKIVGERIPNFKLKRVRSGVATLLAKLRVDLEVRNSLQSHGVNGIEEKHYNQYDFFEEKKAALLAMHRYLSECEQTAAA